MAKKKTAARNQPKHNKQVSSAQRTPQRMNTSQRKRTAQLKKAKRRNNALLWGGGILLVAVLVVSAILLGNRQNSLAAEPLPAEISVDEAHQKYQDDAFVLDVRTPEEWDDYHIPGTTLIPLDELPTRLDEVPQDKEIVVVCRSGNRSLEGRDILLNAGFKQVTSMSGGVNSWKVAGYPMEGQNP
jgi:rhodanese-related sulfurtransferase